MRRTHVVLLTIVALVAISAALRITRPKPPPETVIQGKSVREWVKEVEISGFSKGGPANQILLKAGPAILSDLCAILVEPETISDATLRVPGTLLTPEQRLRQESESAALQLKARAAYVLNSITYHHPDSPESKACVPFLIKGLNSGGINVRIYCVQALGTIGPNAHAAIPAIISRTKDADSGVRMSAVEALGRIGIVTPESLSALTNALSDSSSDVSITATNTLEKLTGKPR